MALHFWYILIHIGLGLVGFRLFTFTNEGGIWAAAAAAVVQAYGVWEIHKIARPRFQASLAQAATLNQRTEMERDYRKRLWRVWSFRTCAYALLTLLVATVMRGGE